MVSFDAGAVLRAARAQAGWTQAELAQRAGVSRMTVQQIEAGTKDPRLSTLVVLLRALGLELLVAPAALRETVQDFVRSGGRVIGQPAGVAAPRSIVDAIASDVTSPKR